MRLPPPAQSLPPRLPPPSTMLKSPTSTLSSPGTWEQNNGKTNQLLGRYNVVRPPSTPDTNVSSSSEMSHVDDEDEDADAAAAALERSSVATNKACATATTMTEENVVLVAENTVSATTTAAVSRGSLEKAAAQKSHTKAVNNGNSNNEDADTSTKTSINLLPRDIFGRIKFNVEKKCVNVQQLEKKEEEVVKSNSLGEIPYLPLKSTTATIESTSNIAGVIKEDCGKRGAFRQNLLTELKEGGNKQSGRLGVAVVTDASCITSVVTPESRSFTVPNNERNRRGTQSSSLVTASTTIDNRQPRLEGDICSNPTTNTTISVESPVSSNPTTTTTLALESRSSSEYSIVSDDPIVHSGWLRKKTKHGKWVRRYFILNATGTIHYSHSESECGKMIRLITGCARIERVKSIPTEFRVYSGSSSLMSSSTATLRARNVNDTICWVETIERICKHRRQQQQQQQHKSIVYVDINQETKSDNILSTMQDQSSNFIDNATELTSKIQMPVVVESLPPDVPITNDDDEPTIEADMTENVEKRDESAPIETLVTILNELIASPTAHSLKIATIEDENDKTNNEPNPRAALIAMLNARSNLLSSRSKTRSKAVENNSERQHQENMVNDVLPKLKDDSVYEKYYKMIKMGLPKEVAKHAMIRDKLDPSILDLDPDRPLKVQRTNSDEKQANITENVTLIIKEDPRFSKYFKMLKMGLPIGAVRNAMQRDKIDPTVLDLDPEKSLESQRPPVLVPQVQDDPVVKVNSPPKDNFNLAKYHKMLKMGLPVGAVLNALKRDGVDPALMNLALPTGHVTNVNPISSIRRKKVYWNQVDAKDGNMWSAVKKLDLKLKHHSSFEGLFTQAIDADKDKEQREASQSPNKSAKTVKVIDSKRGMNGDILLRKVKYSPLELSAMVEHLDCGRMDSHELRSLYEYLPTKEEIVSIRAYVMESKSHNDAIADLTPTEQYMVALLKVVDYEKKFLCLIFLSEFQIKMAELKYDVDQLRAACKELRTSKSFSELLAFILRLVNEINYGVEGCATVEGFTMDSLSKLSETKAFDNKTSVLEYLVKVIRQTNIDILKFQEEIKTVVIAKGVAIEHLLTSVKQLCVDCKTVAETATKHGDEYRKYAKDPTQKVKYRDVKSQRASVKELRQMITFIDEKGVPVGKIDTTHFERFALLAKLELQKAVDILREANQDYIALLQYFGEDVKTPAAVFFGMICQFMDAFDLASVMVEREEEMKLMEARRALAREAKLRVKSIARILQQTDVGNPKHRIFSSTTNCYSVANENKVPSSGAEAAQNKMRLKREKMNDMATSVAQNSDREHISLYHARTNQSKQSGVAEQAVKSERSVKSNGSIRKTSTLSLAVAAAAQRSRASVSCNP